MSYVIVQKNNQLFFKNEKEKNFTFDIADYDAIYSVSTETFQLYEHHRKQNGDDKELLKSIFSFYDRKDFF